MGSPNHWPLWPLPQCQNGSTQVSRGQSWPVHKGVGHHPSTSCRVAYTLCTLNCQAARLTPSSCGCQVIIGCTGTAVCGACEAWHIIQSHRCMQTPPNAPFLQVDGRAMDHLMLVNHIKATAAKLRLNPSRYSGHSLCIRGATSAVQAGLSQWQIKLLGWWNSQASQLNICQDLLTCAGFAAHMAAYL